ncbi:MAG: ECF-type sigma factor [Blastocatellia bacterium]
MPAPQDDSHHDTHEITRLPRAWGQGDKEAFDRLFPLVCRELKRLARRHLHRESHHTLQTSDLVQEAYLKLHGGAHVDWQDRRHFFAIASWAMRQVLVERARKRNTVKRNGQTVSLDQLTLDQLNRLTSVPDDDLIALDEAMKSLEESHARQVRIAELMLFSGLSVEEIAAMIEVNRATVYRDWVFAKAQLSLILKGREKK